MPKALKSQAFTQVEGTPSRQVVISASLAALDPLAPPLAIPDSETLRERLSEQLGMPVVVTLENQDVLLGCLQDMRYIVILLTAVRIFVGTGYDIIYDIKRQSRRGQKARQDIYTPPTSTTLSLTSTTSLTMTSTSVSTSSTTTSSTSSSSTSMTTTTLVIETRMLINGQEHLTTEIEAWEAGPQPLGAHLMWIDIGGTACRRRTP